MHLPPLHLLLSLALPLALHATAYNYPKLSHNRIAQDQLRLHRRQADPDQSTRTVVTPSPGADPVPVTRMSQVVTSYVPVLTRCAASTAGAGAHLHKRGGRGFAGYKVRARAAPSGYGGYGGYGRASSLSPSPSPTFTAPSSVYTSSGKPVGGGGGSGSGMSGSGIGSATESCSTEYSATRTTVCATTLLGMHTSYPVTDCAQTITYSSTLSYARSVPPGVTDAATLPLQTLTYEYLAPWQSLAPGAPSPLQDVTERVCWSTPQGQVCDDLRMVEVTHVVTSTTTTVTTVDLSTTITGPSDVWIGTWHAPVTEVETFITTSGTQVLEYSYETTSTGMVGTAAKVRFTKEAPPMPMETGAVGGHQGEPGRMMAASAPVEATPGESVTSTIFSTAPTATTTASFGA